MTHQSALIDSDIEAYLAQHERKSMLRFLTCGSVDDGKSTLIGRLLYDSNNTFTDQLDAVRRDSKKHGTTGGEIDLALLMDGLEDERQQGITIDVAYRYFSTAKRKFIIADTPGHEQYTRNMATGASTCNLAIILVDARKGVLTQTRRHSFIVSLLGIKHVIVAVNKMDLVDWSAEAYEKIRRDYADFAARLYSDDVHFIPLSALTGDNVVRRSEKMPWYEGRPLLAMLEDVYIGSDQNLDDFRFPVQFVNRPHLDFRGFCGTIASGVVRKGDPILVMPSRKTSRVKSIVSYDGDLEEAFAPQAVTLTLEDEVDISRGDMLVRPGNVPRLEQKFDAMVVWMSEQPLVPGKQYLLRTSTKTVTGQVQTMRYQIDVNTLHRSDSPTLKLNEIGRCAITLNQPVAYDGYYRNRGVGSFILIDRLTNSTVGAGMILDRTTSEDRRDHWDDEPRGQSASKADTNVSDQERTARFGQKAATVLLTGLTGAGKSTIARALERRLFDQGRAVAVLDGQHLRQGISRDLGFSSDERSENLRRGAEVARLFNHAGLITIAAFLAPSQEVRQRARDVIGGERFVEVYLNAPLAVCRARDSEGAYAKADSGEIPNFPGVSSDYEPPQNPDLELATDKLNVEECVGQIMKLLEARGVAG